MNTGALPPIQSPHTSLPPIKIFDTRTLDQRPTVEERRAEGTHGGGELGSRETCYVLGTLVARRAVLPPPRLAVLERRDALVASRAEMVTSPT